ncbi:PREDICTED: uncharacterized protein LOC109192790 [Ipomoea nil]|uniref:uncharacterized protein LOC109192790 n=1 Tax=Ipomoea nil TaxID=35883 RepID=UPI00090135CE|nr:PREDICTED: uncharacterized protein LOC109192790 [Ipomoea nil]
MSASEAPSCNSSDHQPERAADDNRKLHGSSKKLRLSDGRCIAYIEKGVPRDEASYKVLVVHGFDSSKDMNFMAPQELMKELGVYLVLFDRAGYGESDPNPKRTQSRECLDVEEVAELLNLGPKFYLISNSMGSYPTWGCLKRIPQKLLGVAMVVPPVNYQWPSIPDDILTKNEQRKKMIYRAIIWIGKYVPSLGQWWATLNPSRNNKNYSDRDLELIKNSPNGHETPTAEKLKDKRVFDNLCSDFLAFFSKWEFDPLEMSDPFPEKKGSVQIWQGCQDRFISVDLQRYVARKLRWIRYYEVPEGGHCLVYDGDVCEAIFRALLLGEDPPKFRPY